MQIEIDCDVERSIIINSLREAYVSIVEEYNNLYKNYDTLASFHKEDFRYCESISTAMLQVLEYYTYIEEHKEWLNTVPQKIR